MAAKKVKSLTTRQKQTLQRHAQHHTAKHMTMMIKEMKNNDMSFSAAHKKAQKLVGK